MQHLFRHIARTHEVVWVNSIGHRTPGLRDVGRFGQKLGHLLRRSGGSPVADPGAFEEGEQPQRIIHPRVLPWHQYRPVRALNTRSLVSAITRSLKTLETREPPILVTGTPPSVDVVGRLGEIADVYFCMDDFLHLPTTSPAMLAPLEARLLERVDAVVATAESLTRSKRPRTGRAYHLPQGVNFEHFAVRRAVPAEMSALPRPIVGFAGSIYDRLDYQLLDDIAAAIPTGTVVLIGPVAGRRPEFRQPNVRLLGLRPYRELPAYIQAFDVAIIPYVLNAETVAVDPLKLLEYLAAGVPVVATDLPEIRQRAGAVSVAATRDQFVATVLRDAAAPRTNVEERQAFARQHGWERRAEQLLAILAEVVATR